MANDLDNFFVKFEIFEDDVKIDEMICPRSLIHLMFAKWKYPGSPYEVKIIDHIGNFRINSKIVNQFR